VEQAVKEFSTTTLVLSEEQTEGEHNMLFGLKNDGFADNDSLLGRL
jgi:hypothetical protein